jgi:hypothetical protein
LANLASASSDELLQLHTLNGALRDGGHDAAEDACRLGGIRISIDMLKSKRPEVFHLNHLISDVKICQKDQSKTATLHKIAGIDGCSPQDLWKIMENPHQNCWKIIGFSMVFTHPQVLEKSLDAMWLLVDDHDRCQELLVRNGVHEFWRILRRHRNDQLASNVFRLDGFV